MRGLGLSIAAVLASVSGAAAAQAPADITITGSRIFPESMAADSAGNVYVGSNGGTI